MSIQVNNQVWLELEECITCGCTFAVTHTFQTWRKEDKKVFYCPNGHQQCYSKSTSETLREKVEQLELIKNRVMLERDEAQAQVTRAEKKLNACKKKASKS